MHIIGRKKTPFSLSQFRSIFPFPKIILLDFPLLVCYDNVKILNKTWESCNGNNRWGKVWEANVTQGICYETGMLNKKEGVRAYLDADKAKDYFPRTLPSQEYFEYACAIFLLAIFVMLWIEKLLF